MFPCNVSHRLNILFKIMDSKNKYSEYDYLRKRGKQAMIDNNDKDVPRLRDVRIKISDHDLEELGDICGRNGFTIQSLFETLVASVFNH